MELRFSGHYYEEKSYGHMAEASQACPEQEEGRLTRGGDDKVQTEEGILQ